MRPPSVLGDAPETVGSPWLFPIDQPDESPAAPEEEPEHPPLEDPEGG